MTFSYYSTSAITTHEEALKAGGNIFGGVRNPYVTYSGWDWAMDPDGLRYILNEFADRYQLPMMIVENGLGDIDEKGEDGMIYDDYRIAYLKAHIQAMKEAILIDEINLIGYTP